MHMDSFRIHICPLSACSYLSRLRLTDRREWRGLRFNARKAGGHEEEAGRGARKVRTHHGAEGLNA
eukprot:3431343-Pleurochrysis_carterae.AAC.1